MNWSTCILFWWNYATSGRFPEEAELAQVNMFWQLLFGGIMSCETAKFYVVRYSRVRNGQTPLDHRFH
ncbi:hypothetical protein AB3S75_021971 [Citrus x aurantiifolia]